MTYLLGKLDGLHRPRLLIQAARIGAADYRRDTHLRQITGSGRLPRPDIALLKLIEVEANLNEMRRSGHATYSVTDHVGVLIAMMGEARVLRAAHH